MIRCQIDDYDALFMEDGVGGKEETMKDRSTMDTVEFLVNVAWKEVLAFVWYKNLLFRVIPHRDVYESFHVLLIMILGSILFFVIGMRYRKDVWSATACVVLPFGFYTILTYTTTFAFFIHILYTIINFFSSFS